MLAFLLDLPGGVSLTKFGRDNTATDKGKVNLAAMSVAGKR